MDWKKTGISNKVIEEIQNIALKNHVKKVILLGSRARGDFYKKSDIDLAVEGGNFYVTGASRRASDLVQLNWTEVYQRN